MLAEEVISEINYELVEHGEDPKEYNDVRKIRLINSGQNLFAKDGLAFHDERFINLIADKNRYLIHEGFIKLHGEPATSDWELRPLVDLKNRNTTSNDVTKYLINGKYITLFGTPSSDKEDGLFIRFYRSSNKITDSKDEIELATIDVTQIRNLVAYVMCNLVRNKPQFRDRKDVVQNYYLEYKQGIKDLANLRRAQTRTVSRFSWGN